MFKVRPARKVILHSMLWVLMVMGSDGQPDRAEEIANAKSVVDELIEGRFNAIEADYNAQMATFLPPGKLAEIWEKIKSQLGAFKSLNGSREEALQDVEKITLHCVFERQTLDIIIAFDRTGKISGLHFSPSGSTEQWTAPKYATLESFHEQEVTVSFGKWQLPGIIATPNGKGPWPAVVLVHGSGPNDADETVGAQKPFRDLAWGLASHGIEVLRYTKRTYKYGMESSDNSELLTIDDEVVNDARAAVDLLSSQSDVDPNHVYLLGHSLGAYLAPRIANGDEKVHGLIMLAAPARPLEQVAADQVRYLASLSLVSPEKVTETEAEIRRIQKPDLKPNEIVSFLDEHMPGSYWLSLRNYDPIEVAKKLSIPILIIQGERDYQIDFAKDFQAWRSALNGRLCVTFKSYKSLDHLLGDGQGRCEPSDYLKMNHVSNVIIDDGTKWIAEHDKD